MKSNSERKELFVCDCGDISHQFVVSYYEDDPDWPEVFIDVKLNRNLSFWKRIIVAFKYLFSSKPSRFGDFDEIFINPIEADRIQKIANILRERQTPNG